MDPIDTAIAMTEGAPVPATTFKIFTGLLTASLGPDGLRRLAGVASSTTKDLHGDTMLDTALQDMEQAAANNLTIFLNHSYQVPEDVAGSVESARMVSRGVDGDGNPNYDLDFNIIINSVNPRAVEAWSAIQGGTKLGLSIGALIPDGGAVRDKKSGALTISHVYLLETSIVSIPANPRSWISRAVKAVNSNKAHELGNPTLSIDGDTYRIEGSMNGLSLSTNAGVDPLITEPAVQAAAKCPDCGGTAGSPKGDCKNPMHGKAVAPDVTDARVRIIEVDTDEPKASSDDDSSQGADGSEPDDEGDYAAPAPDVAAANVATPISDADRTAIAALEPQLAKTVEGFLQLLELTTRELVTARASLADAITAREAAEQVRDQVAGDAVKAIQLAHDVIEKVALTPLGRKATVVSAAADFSHLEGLYGASFINLLNSKR